VPHVEFKKAGAQTLRLKLIFDSYEAQTDVSETTRLLWKLMESKTRQNGNRTEKVPPPEVAFSWGVFRFVSVITNMTQKFTLFLANGTPVRAEVDITFTQHKDVEDYGRQNPTSGGGPTERIWQVTAGDRLDTIAAAVYNDATKWPLIAAHNGLVNPHRLRPGQRL
ncbi:MAG: LysM peptidoglycan-binding domain-containing protein, partial [Anaerolineales bacterium]|nr:LysM peptidoglycan-binding domain-containing protein [Anaerolineales bacterium]